MKSRFFQALFLALCILFPPLPVNSEPVQTSGILEADAVLALYLEAKRTGKVATLVKLTHTSALGSMTREQLSVLLTRMYGHDKIPKIRAIKNIQPAPIRKFEETRKDDQYPLEGAYRIVQLDYVMTLQRPGDSHKGLDEILVKMLHQKMGPTARISVDEKKYIINIEKPSGIILIKHDSKDWRVLEWERLKVAMSNDKLSDHLKQNIRMDLKALQNPE